MFSTITTIGTTVNFSLVTFTHATHKIGVTFVKGMTKMYRTSYMYPYPCYIYVPTYTRGFNYQPIQAMANNKHFGYMPYQSEQQRIVLKDYGKQPFVLDIEDAAEANRTFRTAIWTGNHLQVTLMSINVNEDIGLEKHPDTDQFLRIEEGQGIVQMGDSKDKLTFQRHVSKDDAIMVPAGKWHNITNTGRKPLKLYSIYAPPEHPFGTVHKTKTDQISESPTHRSK